MADTQVFDDGSTLQTFDDGSTLAIDSAGDISSSPAPDPEAYNQDNTETQDNSKPTSAPGDKPGIAERNTAGVNKTTNTTTGGDTPGNLMQKKDSERFLPAAERSVLHNYRSWTYNFTLGAITPEAVSNHRYLERDIRDYTVLDSAGKGTRGISLSSQGLNENQTDYDEAKGLLDGFNANSPGRFDLYIDNLSVDSTIAAGTKEGGSSIATNISFDVFEPYSMNGLVEALQAASRAAGYSDYMKASFVLRVQFQGWPDTSTNAQSRPEIVPMSTRYFPITITEVGVDVNESGTRYKINSVPIPQLALGAPNKLTSDIKVAGETVGEVLKNFFDAINKMVEDRTKEQTKQPGRDRYEISAPKLVVPGTKQNTRAAVLNGTSASDGTSDIIKAKMNDELTSVNVFKMGDPSQFKNGYVGASVPSSTSTNATSNPSTGKLNPKTGTVVFSAGANIHDCIAAIVRDSQYTRDLLTPENLDKVKQADGLVTYFTVRMETDILKDDDVNNKKFQCFRYVLEPYQMHYTRIPGQEQGKVDLKEVKKKIKREYNYIYSGKNVDVLKFALKFDNLYFTAVPAMLGGRKADNPKGKAAGPNNEVDIKQVGSQAVTEDKKSTETNKNPTAQTMVDAGQNSFESAAKAGQVQGDPYAKMAQNLHNAVLNNVDMITGNLDILGDPYYLVTGGMGNSDLDLKEPMLTKDGQAPTTQGALYININFRNPIDVNSKTGLLDFGSNPISFSGVYQVTQLKNNFKDGMFTQTLDILRVPGQILGQEKEVTAANLKESPLAGQQLIKDLAPASIIKSGFRPSEFNLTNLLGRGLPSIGLPGSLSNFTNALTGGASPLSGLTGALASSAGVGGLLSQVSGVAGIAGNLSNQLGTSPVSGLDALSSGIRLSASGLGSITSPVNLAAASIASAGNLIANPANILDAGTKLAQNAVSTVAALPGAAISAASGIATGAVNVGTSLVQNASSLANKGISTVGNLVGDAKNAIAGLQNTQPTDLASVGSKLGIDTSALAGLSPELASKMTSELAGLANELPENTDIASLKDQGISFANVTKEKLGNLPVVQPKTSAPFALEDPAFAELTNNAGNVSSLLGGKTNLNNLTDLAGVKNPLGSVAGSFGQGQFSFGAISQANSLVNNTIGSAVGLANNVGSLAQNSIQGFAPGKIGLGSIESNIATVANLTQNPGAQFNNLGISVNNQFGSLQASPLTKLVKSNNIRGIG
jgi:hypothetical protein